MKVIYDQTTDTLTIVFAETLVAESDEDKPGVILDYDDKGNLVSLEIMDGSQRVSVPSKYRIRSLACSEIKRKQTPRKSRSLFCIVNCENKGIH